MFTIGDRAAAARILDGLATKESTRIDSVLLSPEEQEHTKTLVDPNSLKADRIRRLFPTVCLLILICASYFHVVGQDGSGTPIQHRIHLYRFMAGSQVGGVWNFVMKLPDAATGEDPGKASNAEVTQIVAAVSFLKEKRIVPNFLPRAVLRAFKERYVHKIEGLNVALISELVAHVVGDESAGVHGEADRARRQRVKLFLELDDDDVANIIIDLRAHNGSEEVYTKFYRVTSEFIDSEVSKVDPRRHQSLSELPLAWSAPNLVQNIRKFAAEQLAMPTISQAEKEKYSLTEKEVPTADWLRLLFCPANPWLASSAAYQCKWNLKWNLMSRAAHHEHPDSEFAARIFKHLRELACELKRLQVQVAMIFADDKCSAKVGEPGDPLAATERGKKVINADARKTVASMHDFAKFKVNPIVMLLLSMDTIPETAAESFYRGQVYVGVKDAVFEASTPFRHAAEMRKILRAENLLESLQVLLLYTDGGPDHNVTFVTVMLAHICLFLSANLDFLVAARTCPQHSWRNCVEKIMCILNLAMYGVALVRNEMNAEMEAACKAAGQTMSGLRKAAAANPVLKEACMAALKPVRDLLASRYEQLSLKEVHFKAYEAATTEEMLDLLACAAFIDQSITQDESNLHMKSKQVKGFKDMEAWMKTHVVSRHYFVVIGKYCWSYDAAEDIWTHADDKCTCCKKPNIPGPTFMQLASRDPLLPDPEPTRHGSSEWAKYAELVAKGSTTEVYRPSLKEGRKRADWAAEYGNPASLGAPCDPFLSRGSSG